MAERATIDVGELSFDARIAGPADGEPVLLLHGFPQTSREWSAQLAALGEAGYRAVAPDQRGYSPGARPTAADAYAGEHLVADVLGIADVLGFERFHLVGHDWGAAVAWFVGAEAPERIVTVNPISVPHPDAFSAELAREGSAQRQASFYFELFVSPDMEDTFLANDKQMLRGIYAGLPDDAVEEYVAFFDRDALTGGLNWYRANVGGDAFPSTGTITVPTMYIWSDQDQALAREPAEMTKDHVTGPYRFEVIEGVNHWVPELAADRVDELLLDHFAQHPA